MKLSNRQRQTQRLELSMTSMIDVVFLLLIFFLVTTTFLRPEKQMRSTIKLNEQNASQSELDPAVIDIRVNQDQVIYRLGTVVTDDLEKIKLVLKDFENKQEGAFVRVADDVPFDSAAKAIGACKASGFGNVSYLPLK